jgi:predicted DNA-binding transcriptional regulator AlpA
MVNWFRVVVDLTTTGKLTIRQISHSLGLPRSSIYNWKSGQEPNHSDGERLIAFWCSQLERSRDEVPMCDRYSPIR